ncbi:MAG TPA: hypothetical protein VKG86_06955 [Terracidiphilus sp.]|nr:hypothetical protein [Terracidiphilus sp.]
MRRKNRKWAATAVALYLFVMWSAYRWSVGQRPTDGPILEHIQHEEMRKFKERRAREAEEEAKTQPLLAEARLNAAAPAFVAARYDATHVVFIVTTDTESRFSPSPLIIDGTHAKIPGPAHPVAPLAGLDELWEPDSSALHFFPEIVQKTHAGDQWTLSLSPDATIPVVIERTVIAPSGCSLGIGFLASVPPHQRAAYAASDREYFLVRRTPVASVDPPVAALIAALTDWKTPPALAHQIEQQLNQRMQQEVANIDARLLANANSPGMSAGELPIGNARPRLKEWIHADRGLARGEGTLDYDLRAFRLTPDGVPRLFVRARWKLNNAPAFLMTAWFKVDSSKADSPKTDPSRTDLSNPEPPAAASASGDSSSILSSPADAQLVLLSADSSWALAMREGEASPSLGDRLDFATILNQFDADHDGWAELLIHSYEASASQRDSTTIAPYLYTDVGLVPLKSPLRRDARSPESCLDP